MSDVHLTADEKRALLHLARATIEAWAGLPSRSPEISSRLMHEKRGVFVTLREYDDLRGCIGYVEPFESIADAVRELAVKSASEDPRFDPVPAEEVGRLSIEVSVLTPLEPVTGPDQVQVGRHGIVVEAGHRRGLLLPEVAVDFGWDAERFFRECCHKAGLGAEAWRRPGSRVYRFETDHFSEAEFIGEDA